MTFSYATTADIRRLQSRMVEHAETLAAKGALIVTDLTHFGFGAAAAAVTPLLTTSQTDLSAWGRSMANRLRILESMDSVTFMRFVPAVRRPNLPLMSSFQVDAAEAGRVLADATLDALETSDHATLVRVLMQLPDGAPSTATAFLTRLGPATVGLMPTLLLEQGVPPDALHRYLDPVAVVLGRTLGTPGLWFRLEDILADQETSEVGATAYLDFVRLDTPDSAQTLAAAGVRYLSAFDDAAIPLRNPPYLRPDGTSAPVDPRLSLIDEVLSQPPVVRVRFVEAFVAANALSALIDPVTPWADDGASIARLLAGPDGVGGELAVALSPPLLREIAGSPTVPPPIQRLVPVLVGRLIASVLKALVVK